MRIVKSFIKEHIRTDNKKFYTVHVKCRGRFGISCIKNLCLLFNSYILFSKSNIFSKSHQFESSELAKSALINYLELRRKSEAEELASKIKESKIIEVI